MQRFWIALPIALALAVPSAYAGKLDSAKQAVKTYVAKKESGVAKPGKASHGVASASHGKASGIVAKGKKLLGK